MDKAIKYKTSLARRMSNSDYPPNDKTHVRSNPSRRENYVTVTFWCFLAHCIALTSAKVSVKRKLSFEILEIRAAAISDHGW